MTLSPTISRWSSLVFVSVFLHLFHAYLFPLSKKTSSRFLSFFVCLLCILCINSLHIIQLIPCKSLWDLTSLVSWGDKCFLCDELGFTDLLFSVQPNPFGTTEAYHSVPPISQQEKQFATYSVFLLIQLHSMNLVLYKHHIFINALCCDSRIKPIHDKFQKPFLEIDVKGGERDHIKACRRERSHQGREKVSRTKPTREKVLRGRKRFPGERILKDPRCLMFKRRDVTCLFGGKTCSYVLICIKFYPFVSFSSDFLFPIFSQYPM